MCVGMCMHILCECVNCLNHAHTHTPSLPQPPTEPNGIITNYTIRYREESTTSTYRTSPLSSNSTHHYIIGLETTSSYLVEVAASTSVGLGPYSEPVAVLTEQPGTCIKPCTHITGTYVLYIIRRNTYVHIHGHTHTHKYLQCLCYEHVILLSA